MKKSILVKITKQVLALSIIGTLLVLPSCKEDEPAPIVPIASFQFEIDAADFFKVNFTNFSENVTTYAWDFGDGVGTSTDKDVSYTYSAAGDYTVKLTSSDAAGNSADQSKDITITDPDAALTLLAGSVSKDWKLLREGAALGIGPNYENFWEWWNLTNDGTRNCIFDDTFTFTRTGGYEYNDAGTFWGEGNVYSTGTDKEGFLETCFDANTENLTIDGVDKSAWLSSTTHSYEYTVATNSITLSGMGAWIGLVKFGTDGDVGEPQASTTFGAKLTSGGDSGVDTLDVSFEYGFWRARYVSYSNPMDEPALTVPVPAPDYTYAVNGLEVSFTNTSNYADTYSWDFGDGSGTSTEENPVYTYAGAGCYDVELTAMGQGLTETKNYTVLVTAPATFDPSILSNATGKIWKLAGEGSYKVGPAPNAGDWWGGIDAAGVTERACQMDDEFVFVDGGVFEYDDKGMIWAEGSLGVAPNSCVDATTLTAPFNGFGSATYAFTADATTITVTGSGAFIGWYPAYNGGEVQATDTALPTGVTYTVHEYIASPCKEVLIIYVETAAGTFWTMTMESTI